MSYPNLGQYGNSADGRTEMQPFLQSGAPPSISQTLSERLATLFQVSQITINDESGSIILENANGTQMFSSDRQLRHGNTRGRIGGSTTNFILPTGHIAFTTVRDEYGSQTTVGDILLGKLEGDPCGCLRNFTGELLAENAGSRTIEFKPSDTLGSIPFCIVNSCCIKNYEVYSGGLLISRINCGQNKTITFTDPALSVAQKAMIIAASFTIYELYFARAICGNVGQLGSRCLTISILGGIGVCLVIILLVVMKILGIEEPKKP